MSNLLPIVEKALEAVGATYRVFDCDPELADTAAFCEHYGFDLKESANTIIVASRTDPVKYAACVVPADSKLDVNKMVCKLLEVRKASFAPMDAALELSGMEYGGVTAWGLPAEVPVFVDSRVLERKEVLMGSGNRSSKLIFDPKEFEKLPAAQIVEGLAKESSLGLN